ncbi:MAG: diguanylate cyclase [Pseudomonadota bacterium]
MKHFDQKSEIEATEVPEALSVAANLCDALGNEAHRAVIQLVIDNLEPGVIFWGPDGTCEMISQRANDMIEAPDGMVEPGSLRDDLFRRLVDKGLLTQEASDDIRDLYGSGDHFTRQRNTTSGQRIMVNVRARFDGGHVVTMSDVSDFRQTDEILLAARAQTEQMEAELARLNDEKKKVEARQEELLRLSLVAAHAKDLILISDATNRIVWANEAFRRHNGLDLEMDLIGKSGRDVLTGEQSDPAALQKVDEAVRNRQTTIVEMVCHKRSGETYWMEQEIIPVFNTRGEHTNFILVGRDISERKKAEVAANEARRFEQAKRAESKLLSEFNEWLQSSDTLGELFNVVSLFLAKLLPGSSGAVYTYGASRDVLELACGWGEDGDTVRDLEPADCWALRRGRSYFFGENTVDIACNHVKAGRDAVTDHHYCLPIIAHGDTVGLLTTAVKGNAGQDTQKLVNFCAEHISLAIANVKLREQLREQSTRDPLTGLYNRRYFLDAAKRAIGRSAKQSRPSALISIDVDHFKSFNDTYGHEAGDAVLKGLAAVLKRLFRDTDVPCRLGGEEFVIIMPGAGSDRAEERAEDLRRAVEEMEMRYSGETLKVTISAGVSAFPDHGDNLTDLMEAADRALYRAKDAGRNCFMLAEAAATLANPGKR